jgi:isochorismate hydrolase
LPDHAPSGRRIKLLTTTIPVTIELEKMALIIIDMQNLFLSSAMLAKVRGEDHKEAPLRKQRYD